MFYVNAYTETLVKIIMIATISMPNIRVYIIGVSFSISMVKQKYKFLTEK
jgi:hypothetical protein